MAKTIKFWNWRYNNMSDSKVPNRNIKWEFTIPYILKVDGSIFGFHGGYSIHIWFLCFGLDFITDVSCGKVNKICFWKWYISLVIRRGWSLELHFGINGLRILDWKVKRCIRRMTPEQFLDIKNQLSELAK